MLFYVSAQPSHSGSSTQKLVSVLEISFSDETKKTEKNCQILLYFWGGMKSLKYWLNDYLDIGR